MTVIRIAAVKTQVRESVLSTTAHCTRARMKPAQTGEKLDESGSE